MNEERNPYAQPYSQPGSAPGLSQEVFPAPPRQTAPPCGGYQPPPQPVPRQGGGAAKAFAVVSFVAGCFSLFAALLCLVAVVSSGTANAASFSLSVVYSLLFVAPGLVFGVLALVKRTRLFPLALLGVIFNGLLLTELLFNVMLMLFHL